MKKLIAMILCAVMVLSLLGGCKTEGDPTQNTTEAPVVHTLQVGFGRADISPEE